MLLTAFILWFGEFALEIRGLTRSRSYPLLTAVFAWCAAGDVLSMVLAAGHGWEPYIIAYWVVKAGKYFLLCLLACWIGAMMVKPDPRGAAGLAFVLTLFFVGIVAALSHGTIGDRLIDGGISAAMLLAGFIALAWSSRNKIPLPRDWRLIAAGLLVLLLGDAAILAAAKVWWPAHHLKWAAEYAQLIMWNSAMKPAVRAIRLSVGVNVEGASKGVGE